MHTKIVTSQSNLDDLSLTVVFECVCVHVSASHAHLNFALAQQALRQAEHGMRLQGCIALLQQPNQGLSLSCHLQHAPMLMDHKW